MQKPTYATPRIEVLGSVPEVTRASFTNANKDSIFFSGVVVGNAQGSMDACVTLEPTEPSGLCEF